LVALVPWRPRPSQVKPLLNLHVLPPPHQTERPDAQMRDMRISISGPNVRVVNCTLDELLLNVLQVRRRSEGGPDWVRERRFDIVANAEEGTPPDNAVLTKMTMRLLPIGSNWRFKLMREKSMVWL